MAAGCPPPGWLLASGAEGGRGAPPRITSDGQSALKLRDEGVEFVWSLEVDRVTSIRNHLDAPARKLRPQPLELGVAPVLATDYEQQHQQGAIAA